MFVSSHSSCTFKSSPRSTSRPAFCDALPRAFEFSRRMLSASSIVSELTVVTVPVTVSEPPTATSPEKSPVVASTASVPPDSPDEIAESTYVLFAESAPSTGAETFLIRFEFISR